MKKILYRNLIVSFMIPILLLSVIFFSLDLVPLGTHNLLISDMGTQYLPFFAYLKQVLTDQSYSSYSFVNGMGGSVLGLYGYYLLSPLNLLFLLFPIDQITAAVMYLILLKIGLISVSSYLYFRFTFKRDQWSMILVSVLFSLSGYVSLYFTNIMWLDALIFFPMVMLGLQLLYERKNISLYLFSLFLTIFTNYYLGYMTCLFAVLYFIYLFLRDRTPGSFLESVKKKYTQIKLFLFASLCAGGLSAVVLVPSLLDMLQTNKSEMDWSHFSLWPNFSLDFSRQFFPFNVEFENRLEHLPTIFIGMLVIFTFRFFLSKEFSRYEKWLNGGMLLLLFGSFWLPILNTVWHMMQKPAGFPYRNAYMISFWLLILAYRSWEAGRRESKPLFVKSFLAAVGIYLGLFLISLVMSNFPEMLADGWLSYSPKMIIFILGGLVVFVGLVLLWKLVARPFWQAGCCILIGLLLFGEMGVDFQQVIADAPFGNQQEFVESTKVTDQLVRKIEAEDPGFYRIDNQLTLQDEAYNTDFNHYNDSFLFNFNGVPLYSSTLNEETRLFLKNLGLYSKNERRISYVGATKVTNLLLDVKYQLRNDWDTVNVVENPEALGIGFGVNADVLQFKEKKETPLVLQNTILQELTGSTEDYLSAPELVDQVAEAPELERLTFEVKKSGFLYLDLTGQKVANFRIVLNRTQIPLVDNEKSTIQSLGYVQQGDRINLSISGEKALRRFAPTDLQVLDEVQFEAALANFKNHLLEVEDWRDGFVKGNITTGEDQVLLLSIPYHENWQATVDGKPVKISEVLNGLMALEVPKGQHQIELHYSVKSLWVGAGISGIFIILTIILLRNWRKRMKE